MKKLWLVCASALVIGLVVGCKNKEDDLVGKWNGPGGVSLTLKADKTFEQGGAMTATGTWTLKDKTARLKIDKVMGKTPTEIMAQLSKMLPADKLAEVKKQLDGVDLTLSEDGKTLNQALPSGGSVSLTKEAKS